MKALADILIWGGAALILYCGLTLLFKLAEWLMRPRKGKRQ